MNLSTLSTHCPPVRGHVRPPTTPLGVDSGQPLDRFNERYRMSAMSLFDADGHPDNA
jgi:hypothetical protein